MSNPENINEDTMNLGEEIYRSRDGQGEINVFQTAERRTLCFGNQVEQSAMSRQQPARLLYHYTRAMMLGALFPARLRHALVLGLGGGSLARTLHHHFPDCRITAVEQRPAVVRIARDWFKLPDDHRLGVHVGDAAGYLAQATHTADLILTDLYDAQGMDQQQTAPAFFQQCRAQLSDDGVVVFNLWSGRYFHDQEIAAALDEAFAHQVLRLNATGRNRIAFGFAGRIPDLQQKSLIEQAQRLGLRLGFPLITEAQRLWHLNGDKLLGRTQVGGR